jgi:hypothetical protein
MTPLTALGSAVRQSMESSCAMRSKLPKKIFFQSENSPFFEQVTSRLMPSSQEPSHTSADCHVPMFYSVTITTDAFLLDA